MQMVHDSVLRFVSLNKTLQECMQMIGNNVLRLSYLNNTFGASGGEEEEGKEMEEEKDIKFLSTCNVKDRT